jgi:glycosyltransferase involved in cell wall biosynthesis
MPNLLHVSANIYPPLNGRHHPTKEIWKDLAKGFDEYHVLARGESNKYSYSKEENINLHLLPRITKKSKIFFFTSFWMFLIIKKYKITHILSQCPIIGGFTATLASKFFKVPLMVEIHGEEYFRLFEKKSFMVKIMKYSFNNASKIRSLNKRMTEKLNNYGIYKNIVEIPNRVNMNIFNRPKKDFILNDRKFNIVSVGRFVWEKDYLNLIKTLHNSSIDYALTLIGGGPLKNEYEEYILKNSLSKKIRLIDWLQQDEMIEIVIKSDSYIQSSVSEGMPRTILEAMALRMPIVSTNVGSIEGVLQNEVNAIVINHSNSEELIGAIYKLINDSNLREKIANQAYTDVCEKYEWNKVFEVYRDEILNMEYKKC